MYPNSPTRQVKVYKVYNVFLIDLSLSLSMYPNSLTRLYPNCSTKQKQHHRTSDRFCQDSHACAGDVSMSEVGMLCAEAGPVVLGEGEEVGVSEVGMSAAWEDSGSWQLPLDDSVRR